MVRQCLFWMAGMDGRRGSQETTQTGLLLVLYLATGWRATSRDIPLALLRAESTIPDLYFLSKSISFNSLYLLSLVSGLEHILFMRIAREKGIFSLQLSGWQLSGSKNLFLSVGFLYK